MKCRICLRNNAPSTVLRSTGRHLIQACIVLFAVSFLSSAANAGVITFETRPNGNTPGDNSTLGFQMTNSNHYYAMDGGLKVTFGFAYNNSELIADTRAVFEKRGVAGSDEGFQSNNGVSGYDSGPTSVFQEQLGRFFLRQPNNISKPKGAFIIDYSEGVSALSGEIWDIDATDKNSSNYESWRVTAYDENLQYIAHTDSPLGKWRNTDGSLDSLPWVFSIESVSNNIRKVAIEYTGKSGAVGLAFNNFNPTQAAPPVAPEPSSLMVFGMGALSCIRFRRR